MSNPLIDPEHWRHRAEETREKANQSWNDEREKQRMLRIAEEYDQLADRAAQWQHSAELLERPVRE